MRNPTIAYSGAIVCLLLARGSPAAAQGTLPPIVYVTRSVSATANTPNQGAIAWRSAGSRLSVLESNGTVRRILDAGAAPDAPSDIQDPDVSYDGQRIVFSGYLESEKAFRIFEINADRSEERQITGSDRSI